MTKVIGWLTGLALDKYIDVFDKAEIDFEVVRELTDADLEKLGIPLGPRKKLLKAIADLREDGATAIADEAQRSAPAGTHAAERRQLTVVFVDLVEFDRTVAPARPGGSARCPAWLSRRRCQCHP